jgi:putative Ca2+/H+ antiporter (TMEM165/GDT1 family)
MKIPFINSAQSPDPLNLNVPYTEKNFEIGFLSSIIHTFILIFIAELGDKTFIMLFILQLRTNKVTIFYSALFAEILMNTTACFLGFLIEYLLYKNLIESLGILFFVVYGIFLILSGFKSSEDTFEEEFAMIEEMHKQRINRTPSMILGIEEDKEKNEEIEKDKYNLDSVNKYNEKTYVPLIKKELTVIPESDISREDSVFNEDNLLTVKKKDSEESEASSYILNKRGSSGLKLNPLNKKKDLNNEIKKTDKNEFENEINITDGTYNFTLEDDNEHNNDGQIDNMEDEEGEEENKFKKKEALYRSRSRYALDYLDKDVNTNQPNIDSSIFGTIFCAICLSEFGDRTQLISLTTSSIFHFFGSILGSCLALFCSCLIGVYFSRSVMKIFKQKILDFLLGALFLGYGIQIYLTKKYSQSAQPTQPAKPF